MEGYKRIFRYLLLYLITAPALIIMIFIELGKDSEGLWRDDIKWMFRFWLIIYAVGILIFLAIFSFYSLFLLCHKISFNIQQFIKKIKKALKLKRRKIWKYPIIIQFTAPKWISASEMAYLYNIKHFRWNISCLFYKWAAEKRISMDFQEWTWLSSNTVKIKIINNSLKDMPSDEKLEWSLIFEDNKEIVLPNVKLLGKISTINVETARSCLEKKLIEKWLTITLTPKFIEWIFLALWILSILALIFYAYASCFLDMFQNHSGWIPVFMIAFSLNIMLIATMRPTKKIKLVRYKLSEKWKKILAEIYWYKYFLEACDEKKIKTFLKEDPEYLDKIMPYAIAIWVETEIIKKVAPRILNWTNVNRYVGNLSSTAKTMLMSSQRTIFFSKEIRKKAEQKTDKKKSTEKESKENYNDNIKVKF